MARTALRNRRARPHRLRRGYGPVQIQSRRSPFLAREAIRGRNANEFDGGANARLSGRNRSNEGDINASDADGADRSDGFTCAGWDALTRAPIARPAWWLQARGGGKFPKRFRRATR